MKRFMAVTASALTLSALFGFAATTSAQVLSTPLYFTDSNANIQRIATNGTITQLANVPNAQGFAFSDGGRSLFVATGNSIQRVNATTGAVTPFALGLSGAQSVVTDRFGNLYTTNAVQANPTAPVTARQVLRYNLAGVPSVVATLPLLAVNSPGAFGFDLAYDTGRDLLFVQGQLASGNGTILRVNTAGANAGTVGNFGSFSTIPTGLTANRQGQVFTIATAADAVQRFGSQANGTTTLTTSSIGTDFITAASFDDAEDPTGAPRPAAFFFDAAFDPASNRVYASSVASAPGATDGGISSKISTEAGNNPFSARLDVTGFDPRRLAFAAVPAPSSVAVMAMGGLMPLIAIARRRRAKK